MLRLPRGLERELRNELIALEESTKMPYVMSYERMALERGEKRGVKRGVKRGELKSLLRLIEAKFGTPTPEQQRRIESANIPQLDRWLDRILTASTLDELLD